MIGNPGRPREKRNSSLREVLDNTSSNEAAAWCLVLIMCAYSKLQRTRSVGRRSAKDEQASRALCTLTAGVQTSVRRARDKLASSSHEVLWSLDHNAGSMERLYEYILYGI